MRIHIIFIFRTLEPMERYVLISGLVPLDELYKLNQIIQEATRREQCLETKLTALKHFTEEAKKSADYTWQVISYTNNNLYY